MTSTNQPTSIVSRDPTSAEIARFLASRTGTQMTQLVHDMSEPAAQATFTLSLPVLLSPPVVHGHTMAPKKVKKAVNSFMGFRGYYHKCPAFSGIPMMKCSGPISMMWKQDPNESVWILIAKAWSMIRDQLSEHSLPPASLQEFVNIICPYLNIPSPAVYMEGMGWEFKVSADGSQTLTRIFTTTAESFDVGVQNATLSVQDIISYCQSVGYAQDYVSGTTVASSTFLARSANTTAGTNTSKRTTLPILGCLRNERIAGRNKRRNKRQNIRNTGIAPAMQRQIATTHITEQPVPMLEDVVPAYEGPAYDDGQFYDELTTFLMTNCPQPGINEAAITDEMFADTGAFRAGADEYAILPPWDSTDL